MSKQNNLSDELSRINDQIEVLEKEREPLRNEMAQLGYFDPIAVMQDWENDNRLSILTATVIDIVLKLFGY